MQQLNWASSNLHTKGTQNQNYLTDLLILLYELVAKTHNNMYYYIK